MIKDIEMINIGCRLMLIAQEEAARLGVRITKYTIEPEYAVLIVGYGKGRATQSLAGLSWQDEPLFKMSVYNMIQKERETNG